MSESTRHELECYEVERSWIEQGQPSYVTAERKEGDNVAGDGPQVDYFQEVNE